MNTTIELGEEEKKRGKETKVLKRKGKLGQGMGALQMCQTMVSYNALFNVQFYKKNSFEILIYAFAI